MLKIRRHLLILVVCTHVLKLKSVKWITDKSQVEGEEAKAYWLCWVTTERSEEGPYYAGVTACYLLVNKSIRRGYKSMPEHVNMMDKSMKHQFIIDQIGDDNKQILKRISTKS